MEQKARAGQGELNFMAGEGEAEKILRWRKKLSFALSNAFEKREWPPLVAACQAALEDGVGPGQWVCGTSVSWRNNQRELDHQKAGIHLGMAVARAPNLDAFKALLRMGLDLRDMAKKDAVRIDEPRMGEREAARHLAGLSAGGASWSDSIFNYKRLAAPSEGLLLAALKAQAKREGADPAELARGVLDCARESKESLWLGSEAAQGGAEARAAGWALWAQELAAKICPLETADPEWAAQAERIAAKAGGKGARGKALAEPPAAASRERAWDDADRMSRWPVALACVERDDADLFETVGDKIGLWRWLGDPVERRSEAQERLGNCLWLSKAIALGAWDCADLMLRKGANPWVAARDLAPDDLGRAQNPLKALAVSGGFRTSDPAGLATLAKRFCEALARDALASIGDEAKAREALSKAMELGRASALAMEGKHQGELDSRDALLAAYDSFEIGAALAKAKEQAGREARAEAAGEPGAESREPSRARRSRL